MDRIRLGQAALELGIDVKTLRKRMQRHDVTPVEDNKDRRASTITRAQLEKLRKAYAPPQEADQLALLRGQVEQLQLQLDQAVQRIDTLEARPVRQPTAPTIRHAQARPVEAQASTQTGVDGLVGASMVLARHFGEMHGISGDTIRAQIDAGTLLHSSIPIPSRPGQYQRYLNQQQQALAVQQWRTHSKFTACPACPHSASSHENQLT